MKIMSKHFYRAIRTALLLVISSALPWCSASAATYGYAPVPLNWIDNSSHTPVTWGGASRCSGGWANAPVDDDITAPLALPFAFPFGGSTFNWVQIMSNGRLQFVPTASSTSYCGYGTQTVGPPPTYPYPYPDPNMNNTMRIYGADFCPAGAAGAGCGGVVTYYAYGVGSCPTSATNACFVATWSQMKEWNSGSSLFNLQYVLYDSGDFLYQYKDIANTSQGVGQVGVQVSTSDYTLVDMSTVNSLAYSALRFYKPSPPIAEYRLDECSGTTAADSWGSYNGTSSAGVAVAATPAEICTAYNFNGTTGYISLPASFPKLGYAPGYTSFTITAWINSTNPAQVGQRIFVDDQNNTGGYALSLGDGGSGVVRFFSRNVNPVYFDSSAVVTANAWYFVVGAHDPSVKTYYMYIYDAAGNQVFSGSQVYTGTWGTDSGGVSVGGENGASSETAYRFVGKLDEVKAYNRVLPLTEINAIYQNERQGLQRDGSLRVCTICNAVLGGFNAFETSMGAGTVAGPIRTKVAGQSFATGNGSTSGNIDLVSLNSGALTNYNGNATVQFLDTRATCSSLDSKGCCTDAIVNPGWPATAPTSGWPVITTAQDSGLGSFSVNFPNKNRITLPTVTPVNAWQSVRIKVTASSPTSKYGCSADPFAIRPGYIDVGSAAAQDANWTTAGAARNLTTTTASGGPVHVAGKPFNLAGLVAKNTAGNVTTSYTGQPVVVPGNLVLPDPSYCLANGYSCVPGTFNVPSWTASSGSLSTTGATYSDVGSFSWEVEDRTFAAVDAADSTMAQRYFRSNAVTYTGRFVPDHYDLTLTANMQTGCSAGASFFTYLGQPFRFATAPTVGILARNAAGQTTPNFQGNATLGGLWKLPSTNSGTGWTVQAPGCTTSTCSVVRSYGSPVSFAMQTSYTYAVNSGSFSNGWDAARFGYASYLTLTPLNSGTGTLSWPNITDEGLALLKNPATPVAPFTATPALALLLTDASEPAANTGVAAANSVIYGTLTPFNNATPPSQSVPFVQPGPSAGPSQFLHGRLRIFNAYGSELLNLQVPLRAEYYTAGGAWAVNTLDSCTTFPASAVALGNYKAGPAGTALSAVNAGTSHLPASVTLSGGMASLRFAKPTPAATGTLDMAINLGGTASDNSCNQTWSPSATTGAALYWLQNPWCTGRTDPNARLTFGSTRTPFIYLRERF
ncbi:MAG: LamG domain-containing protein [Proteobacteria bacterium]|nr:LamG domain-containing protein [Pseudomonadota bacterium]HQR04202.1 LamG domain-containing protein [Rhodocyclaceae bacterium]